MPNIPQIISQLNLLRNGDFSRYVASTTNAVAVPTIFPSLLAHWRQVGGAASATIIPATTVVPDDPHRFVRMPTAMTIEQDVLDQSFFTKPSVREFDGTVDLVAAGPVLTIEFSTLSPFEVNEPTPAPATVPAAVRTKPGDEIQLVNFTNPGSSGGYRVVEYVDENTVKVVAKAGTDPSSATATDVIRILRRLDVFLVDLTVVFSVPTGQTEDDIEPAANIIRELPMPEEIILPLTTLVVGAPTAYDDVTLSAGAAAKQIVCRLTNTEFVRAPRGLRLSLENTVGKNVDVADVGLYVGNYHLPVSTTIPAARGSAVTPLIPGPDHLHLLTGRGDLILMRAGSQAPEGYKKLKEELAFQSTTVTIAYVSATDTSTVTVNGWAVPPTELSGTYEIVFTDPTPAAPAKPGPLDMSVRMSDIVFGFVGGVEIDLTGVGGVETVTFDDTTNPPTYGPIVLTHGTDFAAGIPTGYTAAESLAKAINDEATLGPLMTASASGNVVQVVSNTAYTNDAALLLALGDLNDTVTGGSWRELDNGPPATQFTTVKSAFFTVPGDLSARTGTAVLVVASAPLLAGPVSDAGEFKKPTKAGDGAVEGTISATTLQIDVDGVAVNDLLTFVDDDGDPLAPVGSQGPTYRVTAIDLSEGEVTVVDVTGGATNVGQYVVDPANRYVIEKASGNHTHYAQSANIDERALKAGGANDNTARGVHGHQMYADDTIPPYRKFIICEKL